MEDSVLWRRHLLSFVFQVGSWIYVFMQIFPTDKSLLIPTILVFLAGVIKNWERMLALNISSLPMLREWRFSQRENLDDVASEFEDVLKDPQLKWVNLGETSVVKHAYCLFQMFMVLIGDLMFTFRERQVSREYFNKISAIDGLRVISVELQFMYEVLHTKTLAIHSILGYISRFIAFTNLAMAFVLFNHLKKHKLPDLDVEITYSLLFGGIALDVIALLMLIFSDWTVVGIENVSFFNKFIVVMSEWRKPQFVTCEAHPNTNDTYTALDTPLIFRRWSESISACNLLSEFTKKSPRKMLKHGQCSGIIHNQCWGLIRDRCCGILCVICGRCCGIPRVIRSRCCGIPRVIRGRRCGILGDICRRCCGTAFCTEFFRCAGSFFTYGFVAPLGATLGVTLGATLSLPVIIIVIIFKPYLSSSTVPRIANTKYVSKNPFIKELWIFIFEEVRRKSQLAENEKEVSEIFEARGDFFLKSKPWGIDYKVYVTKVNFDVSVIIWHIATEICYNRATPIEKNEKKEASKILSNYMIYLLLNQSNLMSTVAGIAQIRSADMVSEILSQKTCYHGRDVEKLCESLYSNSFEGTESALSQGIKLAKEMEGLEKDKWEMMSGVWVEMLLYAAAHIKGETHVQVLSQGGELLAFVWLLMVHFGCFYNPEWGIGANYGALRLFNKTRDGEPRNRFYIF